MGISSSRSSTRIMFGEGGIRRFPASSMEKAPSLPDSEAPKLSRNSRSGFTASMRSRTLVDQIAPPEVIENRVLKSTSSLRRSISSTNGSPMPSPTIKITCTESFSIASTTFSATNSRRSTTRAPRVRNVNSEYNAAPCMRGRQ